LYGGALNSSLQAALGESNIGFLNNSVVASKTPSLEKVPFAPTEHGSSLEGDTMHIKQESVPPLLPFSVVGEDEDLVHLIKREVLEQEAEEPGP
jgi:hypothetical protein